MNQSYFLQACIAVLAATSTGNFLFSEAAYADNQTNEMRDLVRQSQGLTPSDGTAEKKKADVSKSVDPAAIYIEAGANSDQAKQIRELRKNLEKLSQTKGAEAIGFYKELHDLTIKAELDEPKILAIQSKLNVLQSDMAMEKTKTLINIRKLLTAKQRENLAAIISKRSAAHTTMQAH